MADIMKQASSQCKTASKKKVSSDCFQLLINGRLMQREETGIPSIPLLYPLYTPLYPLYTPPIPLYTPPISPLYLSYIPSKPLLYSLYTPPISPLYPSIPLLYPLHTPSIPFYTPSIPYTLYPLHSGRQWTVLSCKAVTVNRSLC